jgi:hypothetical protein
MSLVPPSHREGKVRNVADSYEKISQRIKVRQDSADNWTKNDPVLEAGEFGYELGYPNGKLKIGTGSTRWTELPYLMARGPAGVPGPAGPPGKGIQIKGVADVWPPAVAPEPGDLWIMGDPLPPGAPADAEIGDGYVWTGTKWTPTGPIRGPEGVPGQSVLVFTSPTAPTATNTGDLWIEPGLPGEATLSIWDGTDWLTISSGETHGHIVSTVEPVGTFKEGDLWIDPTGTPPEIIYSNTNPPVYGGAAVVEQPNGLPIGLTADGTEIHQPYMVGGVPVTVGGKRYLLPLLEAPSSAGSLPVLLEFADQPTTQQLDGTWIGLTLDGQNIYQPLMVGGIPVRVGGKTYLLPIVDE